MSARLALLESSLTQCRAEVARNSQWIETLKPVLEWKSRIEALEAGVTTVGLAESTRR